jgi:putative sigma-54 modulation protein
MKILVTGRHVEITPSLREFTEKKVSKLQEFFTKVTGVHVILSVEKYRHTAEISVKAVGHDLAARKTTKDMYASIEDSVHALLLQARKLKEKTRTQPGRRRRTRPSTIRGAKVS